MMEEEIEGEWWEYDDTHILKSHLLKVKVLKTFMHNIKVKCAALNENG